MVIINGNGDNILIEDKSQTNKETNKLYEFLIFILGI